jgi:chromosome segregation ATPase
MADDIVGISLRVDAGNGEQTVGELRKQLEAATESARQIGEHFGESSQQFKAAQAQIADIGKALQDAGESAKGVGEGLSTSEAPVKSLRAQLREAMAELVRMQEQFGDMAPEAMRAAQAVAGIRDQLADANEVAALFDPARSFQAVVGVTSAIASGFAAAQGAMSLFGVESKEVEKSLLKVQSAMALAEGLSAVKDSIEDFRRLGDVIKANVLDAFNKLNAVGKVGVLAIAAAAVYLISVLKDWAEQTASAEKSQKVLNDTLAQGNSAYAKATAEVNRARLAVEEARKGIISKEEAVGIYNNSLGETIGKVSSLEQVEKSLNDKAQDYITYTYKKAVATAALQKAAELAIETQLLQNQTVESEFSTFDKFAVKVEKFVNGGSSPTMKIAEQAKKERLAQMQKDREALNTVFEQAQQDSDKAGKRIGADIAGLAAINKAAADKAAAEAKARAAAIEAERKKAREEAIEAERATAEELFAIRHTAEEVELKAVEDKFAKRIQAYKKDKRDISELLEAQEAEQQAIRDKYAQEALEKRRTASKEMANEEAASLTKQLENIADVGDKTRENYDARIAELQRFHTQILTDTAINEEQRIELEKKYTDAHNQLSEARKEIDKRELQDKMQGYATLGNALSNYASLAGEQTAAGKVLAIASTTISTFMGAQAAFTGMVKTFPGPWGIAAGVVAAGAAVAAGIANVRKIVQVQVPGKGGGGGSVPSMGAPISPSLNVQNTNTQLNQSSINAMQNATVKAVVVESDITNSQDRISRIHNAAKLD